MWLLSAAVMSCHAWDEELARVLGRLGDGGTTDGGCAQALCLTQSLRTGASFDSIVPMGPGSFLAYGAPLSGQRYLAVTFDGGFELRPLPLAVGLVWDMAGRSPGDLFMASDDVGAVRYFDGGSEVGGTCGLDPLLHWAKVSSPSTGEAVFVGWDALVCTWTMAAGFSGVDLLSVLSPPSPVELRDVVALSSGERFFAGTNGALVYWRGAGGVPMLTEHSLGKSQSYHFQIIDGPRADAIWAVGEWGIVAHWVPNGVDGGSWVEAEQIAFFTGELTDMYVRDNQDIWLVGRRGVLKHFDGTRWADVVAEGVNANVNLYSVMATGPDDLILAGSETTQGSSDRGVLYYYRRGN